MQMKHIAFFVLVASCSANAMHYEFRNDFQTSESTDASPLKLSGQFVRSGCLEIYISPSHEQALQRKIEQENVVVQENEEVNQDNKVSTNQRNTMKHAQSFSSAAALIGAIIARCTSCSLEDSLN